MKHRANHVRRLRNEAQVRCNRLLDALNVPPAWSGDWIEIDPSRTRMAVDDFKSVLSEIRRLK